MTGRRRRLLLGYLAPAGLIATVLVLVGPGALADALLSARPAPLLGAVALVAAQVLVSAWRWRYTAGRLGLVIPYAAAARAYHWSSLLNMVLPGGVAGDALRAVRARAAAEGPAAMRAAVRSVILERIAGQAAFTVVAGGGLAAGAALGTGRAPDGAAALVVAVPAALAVAALATAAAARFGPATVRAALADLGPDVHRAFAARGAFLVQGATSLLLAASYVAAFALCAAAVGAPLPAVGVLVLVPLVLLSMLVPVSVGGWGVREGAAAALWPLAGLSAVDGAATAALYGLVAIAGTLPGLVVLAVADAQGRAAGSGSSRA